MSDLFISYSSENRDEIVPLVNALKLQGWTVWWDRKIPVGKRYDEVILQALEEAQCVIVVWTKDSVCSDWVRDEASRANKQNKLFPIRLEDVDPPLGFGVIQMANLVGWDGTDSHKEFARLVQALQKKCTNPTQGEIPPLLLPSPPKIWPLLLLAVLPIVIGLFLRFTPANRTEVVIQAKVAEFSFVSNTEQNLSYPLGLIEVNAQGIRRVGIPGTSNFPQESLTSKEGMLGNVLIAPRSSEEGRGSITLDTITLPAGLWLQFKKELSPLQFSLRFHQQVPQSLQSIEINVRGSVDIDVKGIGIKSRFFSFPKTVVLQHEPGDSLLDFTVPELQDNLLPSPLSVANLSFTGEQGPGEDHTFKRIVSAILKNEYLLNGEQQQLPSGAYLQFEHSLGKLTMIRLNADKLEVEFHGHVQGMKSCQEDTQCLSLMPSHWEALLTKYSTLIMVGSIVYFGLIAAGGIRWWKYKSKKSNSKSYASAL